MFLLLIRDNSWFDQWVLHGFLWMQVLRWPPGSHETGMLRKAILLPFFASVVKWMDDS